MTHRINSDDDNSTMVGCRPCMCSNPDCRSVRIFIVNPQIDDDGVFYATLPAELVHSFVTAISKARYAKGK